MSWRCRLCPRLCNRRRHEIRLKVREGHSLAPEITGRSVGTGWGLGLLGRGGGSRSLPCIRQDQPLPPPPPHDLSQPHAGRRKCHGALVFVTGFVLPRDPQHPPASGGRQAAGVRLSVCAGDRTVDSRTVGQRMHMPIEYKRYEPKSCGKLHSGQQHMHMVEAHCRRAPRACGWAWPSPPSRTGRRRSAAAARCRPAPAPGPTPRWEGGRTA